MPPISVSVSLLFGCFGAGDEGGLHALVRALREGHAGALRTVLRHVDLVAPTLWPDLPDALVVPVPGHVPGAAGTSVSVLAAALAHARGWTFAPGALLRVRAGPEAKLASSRAPRVEARTLRWADIGNDTGAVVLVDDVLGCGGTIAACAHAIHGHRAGATLLGLTVAHAHRQALVSGVIATCGSIKG